MLIIGLQFNKCTVFTSHILWWFMIVHLITKYIILQVLLYQLGRCFAARWNPAGAVIYDTCSISGVIIICVTVYHSERIFSLLCRNEYNWKYKFELKSINLIDFWLNLVNYSHIQEKTWFCDKPQRFFLIFTNNLIVSQMKEKNKM